MAKPKPLAGIIGGMGTQATACFMKKLHEKQSVSVEQDYIDILLYSIPSVPDRTAFITGQCSESPLPSLIHAAKTLESAGVTYIALPCATSHFFYEELSGAVKIPILNMLEETACYVRKKGYSQVCLLATDGTIKGGIFRSAFEKSGINVTIPSVDKQSALMELIYCIKRGIDVSADALDSITAEMLGNGIDAVVLGCTELCITANEMTGTVNILNILAEAVLRESRK